MKLQKVPADNKHEIGFSLHETDYSDKDDWARISIPSRVFNGKGRGWNYCSDAVCNDRKSQCANAINCQSVNKIYFCIGYSIKENQ